MCVQICDKSYLKSYILHILVHQIQQQIEIETNVHEATAEFLSHISTRLQEQSVNWGDRRDDDLSSKEQDLEYLKANHARDLHKLKEMEEKHGRELRLKTERELKNSEANEKLLFEKERQSKMSSASAIIQAAWRGFSTRKALMVKNGAKGGKGKKGKK